MKRALIYIFSFGFMHLQMQECFAQSLESGEYGYFTIINQHGEIYGAFQYYDKWNSKYNFFENTCIFYLYGKKLDSDTINITVGYMGDITNGYIVVNTNDSISIYYNTNNFTFGSYGVVDFKNDGYSARLSKRIYNIRALGNVKNKKAKVYSNPNEQSSTRKYLIQGDFVRIIKETKAWTLIDYIPPNSILHKSTSGWIKSMSLYKKDPKGW